MSFDAGAITGRLELDVSAFTHGIGDVTREAGLFPNIISEFMERPLIVLQDVARETGRRLIEMFTEVQRSQLSMVQAAEALGTSVEFMDGWSKAGERVGLSAEDTAMSIMHLSHAAGDAAMNGGDAAQVFKDLGIDLMDGDKHLLTTEALVRRVADALHDMPSGFNRTHLAMQLFSRSGAQMLPFLSQGSHEIMKQVAAMKQWGAVMDDEAGQAAYAFTEAQADLFHIWDGIKEKLAEPVREALIEQLQEFSGWLTTHGPQIQDWTKEIADAFIRGIDDIVGAVKFVMRHLELFKDILSVAGIGIAINASISLLGGLERAFFGASSAAKEAAGSVSSFNAVNAGVRAAGIAGLVSALLPKSWKDQVSDWIPSPGGRSLLSAVFPVFAVASSERGGAVSSEDLQRVAVNIQTINIEHHEDGATGDYSDEVGKKVGKHVAEHVTKKIREAEHHAESRARVTIGVTGRHH